MQSRIIIYLWACVLTACFPIAALQAATLNADHQQVLVNISDNIKQFSVIHSDFTQSKKIKALKRPLLTKGHVIYSRDNGILWQILKPFQMHYILGEETIVEVSASGRRKEKQVGDVPGLAQVGRVFRAMLGVDTAALDQYFHMQVSGDATQWTLMLTPKQAQLAQALSLITLSGQQYIETIALNEAGGDVTTLTFSNTEGKSTLSEAEQTMLGISVIP